MRNLFLDEKLALSRMWFIDACIASQTYDKMLRNALGTYGSQGPNVSGAGRDHFPEAVKQKLRNQADAVTAYCDLAWSSKPHKYRDTTMRQLAQQCADKHGSGFYGPQPSAKGSDQ